MIDPLIRRFGHNLKVARERRRMSQVALAKAAHVHPGTVSKIEQARYARQGPRLSLIEKLCRALKVRPSYLVR
jgi:transcriptional regulator with XRE-family HTH domain